MYVYYLCVHMTHWNRPWCWEGLGAGGEGDDRGWDGWMASPIQWAWVWANSGSLWWTGRPGVLQFMGSQRVGYNWATELNWTTVWVRPSPWVLIKETWENRSMKDLYMNIHNSFICNSPKLKPPKYPSVSYWINKLWYIHAMEYHSSLIDN